MDPLRCIYVFPSKPPSCIIFSEIEQSYRNAAARLGFLAVQNLESWTPKNKEWDDPNAAIIFFGDIPAAIPPDRKAKCALHYTESVGEPGGLVPNQRAIVDYYSSRAGEFDLFLAGTPSGVEFWTQRCRKVALVPLGYDREIMGTPDWTRAKTYDVGFCGTMVGRRTWVFPSLMKRFGSKYLQIAGISGKERNAVFDACKIMLHVGHSEEKAFAHLRLWSAVSTSAALVTEERDAWPAVAGKHYVSLPPAQEKDPEAFVDQVVETLKLPLTDIARTMHEELSQYSSERCLREFMMPAVQALYGP